MLPELFRKLWAEGEDQIEHSYSVDDLVKLGLKQETVDFLVVAGLPGWAAPFLNFESKVEQLTYHYPHINNTFSKYIMFGFDGAGDPIVINTLNNDEIEWLNHENDFSPRFCNTSIDKFGEFLLVYRNFIRQLLKTKGSGAFLNSEYSIEEYETLKANLKNVDPRAVEEGFWKTELDMLLVNKGLKS